MVFGPGGFPAVVEMSSELEAMRVTHPVPEVRRREIARAKATEVCKPVFNLDGTDFRSRNRPRVLQTAPEVCEPAFQS